MTISLLVTISDYLFFRHKLIFAINDAPSWLLHRLNVSCFIEGENNFKYLLYNAEQISEKKAYLEISKSVNRWLTLILLHPSRRLWKKAKQGSIFAKGTVKRSLRLLKLNKKQAHFKGEIDIFVNPSNVSPFSLYIPEYAYRYHI